eukprot:751548-Hanusia_phi.AAC.2
MPEYNECPRRQHGRKERLGDGFTSPCTSLLILTDASPSSLLAYPAQSSLLNVLPHVQTRNFLSPSSTSPSQTC